MRVLFEMKKSDARKIAEEELLSRKADGGSFLRQVILGGQDGLVNVLGVLLGVATATGDARVIIIAGLAATFAESISMAAVAYASSRAAQDYYQKQLETEEREILEKPEVEREEIRLIYARKGFRARQLDEIVRKITSNKAVWLNVMMEEELGLSESKDVNPVNDAIVVGGSALAGSFIPLLPFFFLPVSTSVVVSPIVSAVVLFAGGVFKARLTVGNWLKSGLEMAGVGLLAAFAGYAVGALLGARI